MIKLWKWKVKDTACSGLAERRVNEVDAPISAILNVKVNQINQLPNIWKLQAEAKVARNVSSWRLRREYYFESRD